MHLVAVGDAAAVVDRDRVGQRRWQLGEETAQGAGGGLDTALVDRAQPGQLGARCRGRGLVAKNRKRRGELPGPSRSFVPAVVGRVAAVAGVIEGIGV